MIPVPVDDLDADPVALARFGLVIARDLGRRGYPFAEQVEELAQLVLNRAAVAAPEDRCPWCGGPIVQPAKGRRRRWCSDACRFAASSKRARNAKVATEEAD